MLTHVNLIKPLCYKYTLALRKSFWLNYEIGARILIREVFEFFKLVRQQPSFREELEVIRKLFKHAVEISGEVVLPGDLVHAWKVIDLLMRLHVFPVLQSWGHICPLDVPVNLSGPGVSSAELPVEFLFANLFNDWVLGVEYVENYSLRFDFNDLCFFLFLLLFLRLDHCDLLLWWRECDVLLGYLKRLLKLELVVHREL